MMEEFLKVYILQGVPHLRGFHYRRSQYQCFWLMYVQVGDFCVSRGPPTVPLMRISCNVVYFKSQNPRKAGPYVCSNCIRLQLSVALFDGIQPIFLSLFGEGRAVLTLIPS